MNSREGRTGERKEIEKEGGWKEREWEGGEAQNNDKTQRI